MQRRALYGLNCINVLAHRHLQPQPQPQSSEETFFKRIALPAGEASQAALEPRRRCCYYWRRCCYS